MALCLLFLLSLAVNAAFSARIAGFCVLGGSQYMNMRNVLEELASRGHEVALVVSSAQTIRPSNTIPHKIYQVPYETGFEENTLVRLQLEGQRLQLLLKATEVLYTHCEGILNSTEILEELRDYDLIVHDHVAFCGAPLLGDRLDIPRVEILPIPQNAPFSLSRMIPMPVSYVPQALTGFSDEMTFLQRTMNLGAYVAINLYLHLTHGRLINALKVKYNIKPERSFQEAIADAELVLIRADFALEYAQPLLPGNIMVGPLSIKETKPLPSDLEEFVSNSGGHGFIIVSFGSNLASALSRPVVDMLATAFGKLKQRVLWRLKGYIPSFLAKNIKVVDWLPQNDLLAHKDIKAFVSHVGQNSLYESAYHGVPLVAVPFYGDQQSNAKKVEHVGFALAVNYKSSSAQQLFETTERVITEPRFKTKALHISGLLKDRRQTPLQETCDWIEYVLRHGGARHLRAQVFNIPWYQYYLLDVLAFLVAIVTLAIMVIRLACRCLCRVCCKTDDSKTKKE